MTAEDVAEANVLAPLGGPAPLNVWAVPVDRRHKLLMGYTELSEAVQKRYDEAEVLLSEAEFFSLDDLEVEARLVTHELSVARDTEEFAQMLSEGFAVGWASDG